MGLGLGKDKEEDPPYQESVEGQRHTVFEKALFIVLQVGFVTAALRSSQSFWVLH